MEKFDKETQQKIQELQVLEQTSHSLLTQKQAFQIELSETENAISEIAKAEDDIFKIVANIMIKTDKKKTEEELKKKQKLLALRLKSIESQENDLTEKVEELRKQVMEKIK